MERFTTKTASLKATKATFNKALSKSLDSENIKLRGQNLEDIFGKKYNFDDGKDEVRPHEIVGNIVKVDDEKNEIFIGSQYVPDSSRYAYENREHLKYELDENGQPIRNQNCIDYMELDKAYTYDGDYKEHRMELSKVKDAASFIIHYTEENGEPYDYVDAPWDIYFDYRNMLSSEEPPSPFELYTTFGYHIWDGISSNDYFNVLNFVNYVGSDLLNLTNGVLMFSNMMGNAENREQVSISTDLSNLQYGDGMFTGMYISELDVKSFQSLVSAIGMFSFVGGLTKFNINCPNLIYGICMFEMNNELEEVTSDFTTLEYGMAMFGGCTSLKKFYSALPKLWDGEEMFSGCILDDKSFYIILTSLPQLSNFGESTITLGIDCTEDEFESFLTRKYFSSTEEVDELINQKGWNVDIQFNGETGASTYNIRRNASNDSPKVYVKKTEVLIDNNRNKKFVDRTIENRTNRGKIYNYRDKDGKKYYVSWCHNTKHPEDYTEFNSLEEAIETWNLIKVEYKTIKK